MDLLTADWNQTRPTWEETRSMCQRIPVRPIELSSAVFTDVVGRLRSARSINEAFLACFEIGMDTVFHWFASRNRLTEDGVLASLLSRPEVRDTLPALLIPADTEQSVDKQNVCTPDVNGFKFDNPFLFDSELAMQLYGGGPYSSVKGDGHLEKQLALEFCNAAFQSRWAEMLYCVSVHAWTPWFYGIAWDWTAVLFDRRLSRLWIIAITDTD